MFKILNNPDCLCGEHGDVDHYLTSSNDIVSQEEETDELSKVRLGGFHMLLSYMGAVGKIMGGSGLEEMWYESVVSSDMKKLEKVTCTAKLWLQHFKQVCALHKFMRAKGINDWNLHTSFFQRMLVHFHAAGYIHYAKSVHLRY
ncbi:hypothetical protein AVEN_72208-1 [Araneus ventricosus]|uniref:Uncharacterized protein n=1 Tax=Araneus ventricosus TaxID=182803 RepID=A0A4Y2HEQ3_ARAVE|nr:hypothetical protein AVEN_72208-1 [Araneus ventricosus]